MPGTAPEYQIFSSPWEKKHIVYQPAANSLSGPPRKIEYLHELVHALLCEKVHHQFGTSYFERETPDPLVQGVTWACKSAQDWFVDAKLYELAPEQVREEIKEHYSLVCQMLEKQQELDIFLLISTGFILAQASKYLNVKVRATGQTKQVIEAFLSISPEGATVHKLENLINKVLAVYSGTRIQLIIDGNFEVWRIQDATLRDQN